MKKFGLIISIVFGIAFLNPFPVNGQDEKPLEPEQKFNRNRRPNLLAELDLNAEQVRSIRRINQENRFSIRQAQQRLREANSNLDAAIYADAVDETEFQRRVKELQNAQIEVIRARSSSELAIRKILTAPQLTRFRELRRRFVENREEARPNIRQRQLRNLSNRRFNNRQRQTAPNN